MGWIGVQKVGDGTVVLSELLGLLGRCIVGRRVTLLGPPPLKRSTGKVPGAGIIEGTSITNPT